MGLQGTNWRHGVWLSNYIIVSATPCKVLSLKKTDLKTKKNVINFSLEIKHCPLNL